VSRRDRTPPARAARPALCRPSVGACPTTPRRGDPLPLCTVCGYPLPDHEFPGVTTCAEWCDAAATRLGDILDDDTYRRLVQLRNWCRLFSGDPTLGEEDGA
jgi:hypothetical protein